MAQLIVDNNEPFGVITPKDKVSAQGTLKGNPVKFGSGPAAVTGDKICKMPLFAFFDKWEGADSRVIRESEDLPCR